MLLKQNRATDHLIQTDPPRSHSAEDDRGTPQKGDFVKTLIMTLLLLGLANGATAGEAVPQDVSPDVPVGDHQTDADAPTAVAVGADEFTLESAILISGGGTSEGGGYAVAGTVGEPVTGILTGGEFRLSGGFWPAALGGSVPLFQDGFESGDTSSWTSSTGNQGGLK